VCGESIDILPISDTAIRQDLRLVDHTDDGQLDIELLSCRSSEETEEAYLFFECLPSGVWAGNFGDWQFEQTYERHAACVKNRANQSKEAVWSDVVVLE